jgi:hypothetical protein
LAQSIVDFEVDFETGIGMNKTKTIKRVKLVASVTMLVCLAAAFGEGEAQVERPKLEVMGLGVPLGERLGADDGFQFAVHFSGDTHGSLEPCG